MNNRNSLTRYSLNGESSRWWWPSATAGAAATLTVVAVVGSSSAGYAIPVDDHDGTPAAVSVQVPAPTDAGRSIRSQDDIPPGYRQCFMWQPNWQEAIDGPQPWCPIDKPVPTGARDSGAEDGTTRGAAAAGDPTAFSLRRAELARWVPIP